MDGFVEDYNDHEARQDWLPLALSRPLFRRVLWRRTFGIHRRGRTLGGALALRWAFRGMASRERILHAAHFRGWHSRQLTSRGSVLRIWGFQEPSSRGRILLGWDFQEPASSRRL